MITTRLYEHVKNTMDKGGYKTLYLGPDDILCRLQSIFIQTRAYSEWTSRRRRGTSIEPSFNEVLLEWVGEVAAWELEAEFTSHELVELLLEVKL